MHLPWVAQLPVTAFSWSPSLPEDGARPWPAITLQRHVSAQERSAPTPGGPWMTRRAPPLRRPTPQGLKVSAFLGHSGKGGAVSAWSFFPEEQSSKQSRVRKGTLPPPPGAVFSRVPASLRDSMVTGGLEIEPEINRREGLSSVPPRDGKRLQLEASESFPAYLHLLSPMSLKTDQHEPRPRRFKPAQRSDGCN